MSWTIERFFEDFGHAKIFGLGWVCGRIKWLTFSYKNIFSYRARLFKFWFLFERFATCPQQQYRPQFHLKFKINISFGVFLSKNIGNSG